MPKKGRNLKKLPAVPMQYWEVFFEFGLLRNSLKCFAESKVPKIGAEGNCLLQKRGEKSHDNVPLEVNQLYKNLLKCLITGG